MTIVTDKLLSAAKMFVSLLHILQVKNGDTVFVSTSSGEAQVLHLNRSIELSISANKGQFCSHAYT